MQRYTPSPAEWASLTIQPVTERGFRAEHVTEGKIAIDEDRSTPVFSPYAGRVTRLLAKPGDSVVKGQPLFVIEAADNVQAQNDFIAAMAAMNKAKSALDLAQLQGTRAKDLFEGKAVPLKDYQQSQATLIQAENDMRSSQTAMEAARNKLRILGLSDEDIATFQEKRIINPETTIFAPIAGTVVQRKIGPGQYVNAGASDPVYVIGDLSTVWMTAFVRESDCANVAIGQEVTFNVLALPGRPLSARLNYVATAIDPATRRLLGPRHHRQQGLRAEAGDVRQRHDLFGGRPSGGRRAEAGTDLRGRSGADLGRASRTRRSNCVRSSPASPMAISSRWSAI